MKSGQLYYLREQCQGHGHLTRERFFRLSFLPACQYKHNQPFHLSPEIKNHWQTTLCLYLGSSYCSVWNDRRISGKPGWNLRTVFLLGSRNRLKLLALWKLVLDTMVCSTFPTCFFFFYVQNLWMDWNLFSAQGLQGDKRFFTWLKDWLLIDLLIERPGKSLQTAPFL